MVLDDIRDHIEEIDGEISSDCILSLSNEARDVLFDLIEDAYRLLEI